MFVLVLFFLSFISNAFADSTTYGHCIGPVVLNSTVLEIGPNQFLYEKYSCQAWANVTDVSNSTDSGTSLPSNATGTTSDLPTTTTTTDTPSDTTSDVTTSDTTSDTTSTSSSLSRRGFFDLWPLCILFHTCRPYFFPPGYYPQPQPPPPPKPRDVCDVPCYTSCNDNVGQLPPVEDDCQTIQNSIQIFSAQLATDFTVASGHQETLSFGTCTIFFENLGKAELDYCWTGLSNNSALAETACFPPVHPPFSEGLCTSYDGSWSVGIAHS